MSSLESAFAGLAPPVGPAPPASPTSAFDELVPPTLKEEERQEDKSRFRKFLEFLNRGTSAGASAVNELVFDPNPEPVQEYINGLLGKGKIDSFSELTTKMGWSPTSKQGKALKGIADFGLDVFGDVSTYVSLGAAPAITKVLPRAGKLLQTGLTATQVAQKFGKGAGAAAKLIETAQASKDPRVGHVVSKLLKGDKISRAEEAVLDARSLVGLQNLGIFGNDDVLKLTPKAITVKFFDEAEKFGKLVEKAPIVGPIYDGFGKAFQQYHEIAKKFPTLIGLRRNLDSKKYAATSQGLQRALKLMEQVGNEEERKLISHLMENPDETVVTGSFFKDITQLVERSPHIWADMGHKVGDKLTDEDAVELVSHYFNRVNDWISEYGPEGLFSTQKLLDDIRFSEGMIATKEEFLGAASARLKGGEVPDSDVIHVQRSMKATADDVQRLKERVAKKKETLQTGYGPIADAIEKYDIGKGAFGQVKGRFDIVKFQNKVLKLPVQLDQASFSSIIKEHQAYKALEGIPGIGSARLVWKELPLSDPRVRSLLNPAGAPTGGMNHLLGFIKMKDGEQVLRIPHLIKNLVDISKEHTGAFHGVGGQPHWRMPTKAIRSFEKLLSRASRAGVALADLHSGNLVIDKQLNAHFLDLGYNLAIDKSPLGIQQAWRTNLAHFTKHILHKTRFTSDAAKDAVRNIIDPQTGMIIKHNIDEVDAITLQRALDLSKLPVRYLDEAASTKPMTEGFVKLPTGKGLQPLKMTQRMLVEERVPLVEKLSPAGKEAFEQVQAWKQELTDKLLDTGLLTEEWIEGFEQKFGIEHLRHLRTPEGLIRRFQHVLTKSIVKGAQPGTLKGRKIEGTLKEINKQFGREFFETDVAKIMFASHVEVMNAVENWKYIQHIADNPDWTRQATKVFRNIKQDGAKKRVSQWIPESGYELINHPLFEGKMVPQEIAKDIKNIIEKSRQDFGSEIIKKYYDPVHNWLRSYSLFLYPSFFIRNFAGGVWNNFLGDVNPGAYGKAHDILWGNKPIKQTFDEFRSGRPFHADGITSPRPNKKLQSLNMTYQEVLDEMNEFGVLGKGQYSHVGEIEQAFSTSFGKIKATQLFDPTTKNAMLQFGQRVGNQIEHVLRASHYIDKRAKGLSPQDAALSVKKHQFDYTELSDFEKNWLKRGFFFYPYARKNIPLQAQSFLTRPGKFSALGKGVQTVEGAVGGPDPNDKALPDWIHKQLGVKIGYDKEAKTYKYWLMGGWVPAADLDKLFRPVDSMVDMVTPLLRTPVEMVANKSFYFDQPLEEYEGQRRELLSPEAGAQVGLPEGITTSGRMNHLLRQFRVINESRRVLEAASKGGPKEALMQSVLGRVYSIDPEQQLYFKNRELKFQLSRLKSDMKRATSSGKKKEAERIRQRIIELQRNS